MYSGNILSSYCLRCSWIFSYMISICGSVNSFSQIGLQALEINEVNRQ